MAALLVAIFLPLCSVRAPGRPMDNALGWGEHPHPPLSGHLLPSMGKGLQALWNADELMRLSLWLVALFSDGRVCRGGLVFQSESRSLQPVPPRCRRIMRHIAVSRAESGGWLIEDPKEEIRPPVLATVRASRHPRPTRGRFAEEELFCTDASVVRVGLQPGRAPTSDRPSRAPRNTSSRPEMIVIPR